MLRVARTVFIASAVGPAASFVRNVVLARTLGVEDFAVSIILLSIAAMSDILSDMGWEKYLVSSNKGEDRTTLQVVHFAKLWTGAIICGLIVAISPFVARWIDRPEAWPAFAAIGAVTLLRASYSVDYKLSQRDMDFSKEGRVESFRGMADLAAATLFALLLQTYWATVLGLVVGALIGALSSHAMRTFSYRPAWTSHAGRPLLRFGIPLLANNVLVFLVGQGDRLAVGFGSPASLVAAYGASLALLAGPQAVLSRMLGSTALPLLAGAGDDREFNRRYALIGRATILAAAAFSFPVIAFGPWIVALIFGPSFIGPSRLIELLAIAQGLQLLRSWPVAALVSTRKTAAIPFANFFRLSGVALAAASVTFGTALWMVPASLIIGEVLGLAFMMNILHRAIGRAPYRATRPLLLLAAFWSLGTLLSPSAQWAGKGALAFGPLAVLLFAFLWTGRKSGGPGLADILPIRLYKGRADRKAEQQGNISE